MKTIVALSTPIGTSAVALIRLSGDDALNITKQIFICNCNIKSHYVTHGKIVYRDTKKTIDDVLLTYMQAPKSFSGEDVVEICTHGSMVVVDTIIEELIKCGASLADRGEFAKRAFLNGKIDLSMAEGIIDLINSKNHLSMSVAVNQLEGKLSKDIEKIRTRVMNILASLSSEADYPDEGVSGYQKEFTQKDLIEIINDIDNILNTAKYGQIAKHGVKVVLLGRPNVGKSSLLNAMLGTDRAIVTHIAGTTRDVIYEQYEYNGIPFVLIDTAGLRKSDNLVEEIGIKLAYDEFDKCDIALFVYDGTQNYQNEFDALKGKDHICVINKCDQNIVVDIQNAIKVSAKTLENIDLLKQKIFEMTNIKESTPDQTVITNTRHKECLIYAKEMLVRASETLRDNMPPDLITIDLELALSGLGQITGQTVNDEVVDNIFKNFCVGK